MKRYRGQNPATKGQAGDMLSRVKAAGSPARALLGSETAFTLLELTISLVMIGIIVLIILGAMRLGFRSVDSGERKIEALERLRTSLTIVNSQIQSEIPLTWDDDGERKFYFSGDREALQFATNYSIWGGQTGYVVVRYTVESDDRGKYALAASENIIGTEHSRATRLFEGLDSIFFEYFYQDPTEEQGNWVDQWPDTATTPDKIRLHLVQGEKDVSMIIPMRTPGVLSGRPGVPTSSSREEREEDE
jgi:general secretion pathway protein J